ncbi:MAG: hypothetical protein M1829_001622 [Trizodia sp. TS-e1964]|nr:MAG: hypothetical protein M1829_001622 [Trizodia sp. TS-e1964]
MSNNAEFPVDFEIVLRGKYPAKAHAEKVAAYIKSRQPDAHGVLYLEGQKTRMIEDNDEPQPFRQRRPFYYLSGCALPDCHLTYDLQSRTLTLFIPPLNPAEVMWTGLPLTPNEALELYDVDAVRPTTDLPAALPTPLYAIETQHPPSLTPTDQTLLRAATEASRITKSPYEVALIAHANAVSAHAHTAVMQAVRTAASEQALEALFVQQCMARGCRAQAYHPIVAAGRNAATLHYQRNDAPLAGARNLLLDAGGEYKCYAADITRTMPVGGKFDALSRGVYEVVLAMQEECIKLLRPGVRWEDVHVHAHRVAIRGLLGLGILRGDAEEIFSARTSVAFFPHGLGHHLGLDVHDVGGNPDYEDKDSMFRYLRVRGTLPEGAVVTVEPGIYFCHFIIKPYLEDAKHAKFIDADELDKYWDVGGVRIEDNVLIDKNGYRNLTSVPKQVAELEKLMGVS